MKNITRFKKLVSIIIENEGGAKLTNHKSDPGGVTKYGISKKYNPDVDVANLTQEQAEEIYLKRYYLPCGADDVNDDELALNLFDSAVNPGLGWINKTIQKFVKVMPDGKIGPKTIEAINNHYDKKGLIALIKVARKEYYQNIVKNKPTMAVFLKGWLNRVNDLKL